jgi:hypothetical protein
VARLHFGKRKLAIPYQGSGTHYITSRELKSRAIGLTFFACIWLYSAQGMQRDLDLVLPLGSPEPATVVSTVHPLHLGKGKGWTQVKVALAGGSTRTLACPHSYKLPIGQTIMVRPTEPSITYSLDNCRALRMRRADGFWLLVSILAVAIAWLLFALRRFAIDLRAHLSKTELTP